MSDRIFRPDVGDYMNDQEYAIHKAKVQALNQAQNPEIQALAQDYRQNQPSQDSVDALNQQIANGGQSGDMTTAIQNSPGSTLPYTQNKSDGGMVKKESDGTPNQDRYSRIDFHEGGEVPEPKFKRMKSKMGGKKATAELDASKNPEKFMEENKEMSIKGRKGVAF